MCDYARDNNTLCLNILRVYELFKGIIIWLKFPIGFHCVHIALCVLIGHYSRLHLGA